MTKRRDYLTLTTIVLLVVTSMAGILSIDFTKSYEIVNQYGHIVEMYWYGLYAYDTYFQAPISIGTDICVLLEIFNDKKNLIIYIYYEILILFIRDFILSLPSNFMISYKSGVIELLVKDTLITVDTSAMFPL